MSDIRARAIYYARQCEFTGCAVAAMTPASHVAAGEYSRHSDPGEEFDTIIIDDPAQFRIGIDNMLAAAFEMGYAAAVDDRVPTRALRDEPRSRRTPTRRK